MGKFTEVTYDQLIAQAKMHLNLENTTDHDAFLELMADECMRQINDLSLFEVQTVELELNDASAKVPCGFIRLMGAWYRKDDGTCYAVPYVDRDVNDYCGCTYPVFREGTSISLNGPYLNFNTGVADEFTSVSIAYWGMRMNGDNMPIVYERHVRAVVAYLCSKLSKRLSRSQPVQWMRREMKDDADRFHREYVSQKLWLRGLAQEEQFQQDRRSISRTLNAWITRNNMRGRF